MVRTVSARGKVCFFITQIDKACTRPQLSTAIINSGGWKGGSEEGREVELCTGICWNVLEPDPKKVAIAPRKVVGVLRKEVKIRFRRKVFRLPRKIAISKN